MKIEKIKIEQIVPYENNPRHNDGAVKSIMESIRQCEYINPIIVDENLVIIAGHARYKALKALGYDEVDCIVYKGLSEETKKKYRFLDNKTGEKAEWDLPKLEEEIEGIDLEGFDFFGLASDLSGSKAQDVRDGGQCQELDVGGFADEHFKYQCPECGFRFN